MSAAEKSVTIQSEIWLFEIPFFLEGLFREQGADRTVRFSVRVGNKTLGEVLRYLLDVVGGPTLRLDPPWNIIESIRLDSFAFVIELTNGKARYGFSYSDLGIDLTFAQLDKLEVFYAPKDSKVPNSSLDINLFGKFLGVDFTKEPISWDALKEQPPQAPAASDKILRLDYLGLGQRVTLRDISKLETIGAVVTALRNSYQDLGDETLNPVAGHLPALTYDESAAWLVGAQFSVLETFDFSGLWNLPKLAGARIGLRGERAKSLAGFEFEILYRRIAADLGQYHLELILPDVLRRFQAGAASVTLPIIAVEIYTDGGFKIDLGFPKNLNFERSFSIEMMIGPVPVTGAIGIYFGRLSALAVPNLPTIRGGSFGPVIIAGVGFRIGVGKSFNAGILSAGIFIGIEGLIEGVLGFYEPFEASEPKATFYRVSGYLALTGHIYGKVDFAIISAAVDVYAYVSVQATFEAYRATLLLFQAGVSVSLSVKVGWGWFSFTVRLSFSATIREQILIGQDQQAPWQLTAAVGTTLKEKLGPVAYRRLPTGEVVADGVFTRLLDPTFAPGRAPLKRSGPKATGIAKPAEPVRFELFFWPVTALGIAGDRPGGKPDPAASEVALVAALTARLSRGEGEPLSPAEVYAASVLRWGLSKVHDLILMAAGDPGAGRVTLSQLHYLQDHIEGAQPPIEITPEAVREFFSQWVAPVLLPGTDVTDKMSLTAFPMIPLLTLKAGEAAEQYSWNFETEPLCTPAYRANIRAYFEQLDPMRVPQDNSAARDAAGEGETLSMASLVFFDCFKLVLRKIVGDAIEALDLLAVAAAGRDLAAIAAECGLGNPAGLRRIIAANLDNNRFFAAGETITAAANGVPLEPGLSLATLALKFELPTLRTARAIYSQPLLDPNATVELKGVRHLITADDTRTKILELYKLPNWDEVIEANPLVDWHVPAAVPDSRYPTLELPAGSWIDIPPFKHALAAGHSLATLAELYGLSVVSLVEQAETMPMSGEGLARQGITVNARAGETIAALGTRVGAASSDEVARNLLDDPLILAGGGALKIPAGTHIIARSDTLNGLAVKLQTSPEAIANANKDELWKLIPRPNTSESLPMGVKLALPQVDAFQPQPNDTFASIARLFELDPLALARANAETFVLPVLVEVTLPLMNIAGSETPPSPIAAAQLYGVAPEGLVRANQGAASGPGAAAPLGTVLVPECESIEEDALIALLASGGEASPLAIATQSQARFILAGLRLPKPDGTAMTAVPGVDEPLYPLYTLSGQQWPAPAVPNEQYWVELSWNGSTHAMRMACAANGEPPPPTKITLKPNDITLINNFRTLAADTARIQPAILNRTAFPAFQQIQLQQVFGSATPWSVAQRVQFVDDLPGDRSQWPMLLEIPPGMRRVLQTGNARLAPLVIAETMPDPVTGAPVKRTLSDIGWATRIDIQIRRVYGSSTGGDPLPTTYEAVAIEAQGQADLEGIRAYILSEKLANPIDLYLLYQSDDLGPVPETLRSDAISKDDRARITLIKSNLSTFSNPAALGLVAGLETPASATLAEGLNFLELLWQISVTNGGGFFLDYPVGPDGSGLPEGLFATGEGASITILAVLRRTEGTRATIEPARFHNVLVTCENLTGTTATVRATASDRIVKAVEGSNPEVSEALGAIAAAVGIQPAELARLNASNGLLLNVGVKVVKPATKDQEGNERVVLPGDDLLSVAIALELSLAGLADLIQTQQGLLSIGAKLEVRPGWVSGKSLVQPDQGGLRVFRQQPVEPKQIVTHEEEADDAAFRIQTLFQLMGYSLAGLDGFTVSRQGLPIVPQGAEPAPVPWTYQRLLPIAPFAQEGRFDQLPVPDPYAGLGRSATVEFGFHDVFGNRLPRAAAPEAVTWAQLYKDPLVPLHAWPSVTLSYDVDNQPEWNAPRIIIRIKFAPAGYAATIGVTQARMRQRIEADQRKVALSYYQVADERVDSDVLTTLTPGDPAPIDSDRLARFASDIYSYYAALLRLEPEFEPLTATTTIRRLATAACLKFPADMARHLADQAGILRVGATVIVPERVTVLPSRSLDDLSDATGGELHPGEIGILNAEVLLTPGLNLDINGIEYPTEAGNTLTSITPPGGSIKKVALDNRTVKGLFVEGSLLSLGATEAPIGPADTLRAIADARAVGLDVLANANVDRAIFAVGGSAELPLHLAIPPGTGATARVGADQSLSAFVAAHGASIRDVLTANSATTSLLRVGETVRYRKDDKDEEITETVLSRDTLATITLRFGTRVKNPSLKPADVGAYPANADNKQLLLEGALMLLPPIRLGKDIDVPRSAVRNVSIDPLGVELRIFRNEPELIDPAFVDVPEVAIVSSTVPARLSSAYSLDERATLKAFARQFQQTFTNLKLCVGPDVLTSASLRVLPGDASSVDSKLMAVHWGNNGFDATVKRQPVFYAPGPLLNKPWNANGVPIEPYVPGRPFEFPPGPNAVPTNFNGVDLERWAWLLLSRIDRVLKPDIALPLRSMSPSDFQTIVDAKAGIANAVAARVELVLEPPAGAVPDREAAAEQLKQQLLVELGATYQGGVVIQFPVEATTPNGEWTSKTAPRLLGAVAPLLPAVPPDDPTLDGLARSLDASAGLVAELVQNVGDLLIKGFKLEIGKKPVVEALDTLATIAAKAEVDLAALVAALHHEVGFLRPGAEVPLTPRKLVTDTDDTFGSVLERLAPNLTSRGLVDAAIRIFVELNGKQKGVFVPDVVLEWEGAKHTTSAEDTMRSVAQALNASPVGLYDKYYVTAPLIRPETKFIFLARIPPISISATKIALFPGGGNTMNAVFVTTTPDDASNVSLDLRFLGEALEYKIHDVAAEEKYQASEWLTFVDFEFSQGLGTIDVPIPNRQFPLPPQVLSHTVQSAAASDELEELMRYDYDLRFAFDAATQDELEYTRYTENGIAALLKEEPPASAETLATLLAQYQAIDGPLWENVFRLRTLPENPVGEEDRKLIEQAVKIFADLARRIAASWADWHGDGPATAHGRHFRIRRHTHPDGRLLLTVTSADKVSEREGGISLPKVRALGRKHSYQTTPQMTVTTLAAPGPIPRTRRGEFYEVHDNNLNLLEVQRCWGGISVSRNRHLVDGAITMPNFVLQVPDVRAVRALTPSFTFSHRIDAGGGIAPLAERLKGIFEKIYFPAKFETFGQQQRASVTATFARRLAEQDNLAAAPDDRTTLFAPVVATPLLVLSKSDSPTLPTPKDLADQVAKYLNDEMVNRGISSRHDWSLTLKLFSSVDNSNAPPQLLEISDLRVPMADH